MKSVKFVGYSDNTFGFDILNESNERVYFDAHDDGAMDTVRAYRVESKTTSSAVIVTGVYGRCPGPTWSIGISPDDEGIPIPEWASRPHFKTDKYSVVLTLVVPDDVRVTLVGVDGKAPDPEDL